MNQILYIRKTNKKFFIFQFIISFLALIVLICFIIYYIYNIRKDEEIARNITGNYDMYKLYSNISKNNANIESLIFGTIEIPKINLHYSILTILNENNLKISPCKFYGSSLEENGNICIAGHNYDNNKFFSNLNKLNINDIVYIFDNYNKKYSYAIYKIYEVKEDDLSPVLNYDKSKKELTLITCNNFNRNRLVVKAQAK